MRTPTETIAVTTALSSFTRLAKCTNTRTVPLARCCFASATGVTCAHTTAIGAATKIGRSPRKTPSTIGVTR
jgi:hypothetical protein